MESNPRDYGEQCRFDAFCKKVLRNEARAYLRNMKRQREREALFSDLSQAELDKLCVVDRYPSDSIVFSSHGYDLHIDNELVSGRIEAQGGGRESENHPVFSPAQQSKHLGVSAGLRLPLR